MIIIDGNTTKRYTDCKEVPTEDFISNLRKTQKFSVPFLPRNCFGVYGSDNRIIFVIEREPGIYPLNYTPSRLADFEMETHMETFDLYFPWTYFFIEFCLNPIMFSSVKVKFAKKRPKTKEDKIGYFPLPNVNDGELCFGDNGVEIKDFSLIHESIDEFRCVLNDAEFNDDYTISFPGIILDNIENVLDEEERLYYYEKIGPSNYPAICSWENLSKDEQFQKSLKVTQGIPYGEYIERFI